jgi:hypothetical protein
MHDNEYQRAIKLYGEGKDDDKSNEAFFICRKFLLEPSLGGWHRAGFHLLLGHLDDCML